MFDLDDLGQDGVATRRQLLQLGLTEGQIRGQLTSGSWQLIHAGVYATFSGPVPPLARVWAAILRAGAGAGAVAGPRTSLWLWDVVNDLPHRLDVAVPSERHVCRREPFRVLRRRDLHLDAHPAASPPRLRVEIAVLATCGQLVRPDTVVDLVVRAVQRRVTTARRLDERLAELPGHRWRGLLTDLLADVTAGVSSTLDCAGFATWSELTVCRRAC